MPERKKPQGECSPPCDDLKKVIWILNGNGTPGLLVKVEELIETMNEMNQYPVIVKKVWSHEALVNKFKGLMWFVAGTSLLTTVITVIRWVKP